MIVLSETEDCAIISLFVWTKHQKLMDGRTDGQTDLPWPLQRSASMRAMQTHCKN